MFLVKQKDIIQKFIRTFVLFQFEKLVSGVMAKL